MSGLETSERFGRSVRTFRAQLAWGASLTVVLVVASRVPAFNFFSSVDAYASLHTALELAAMTVATMVFALTWNLRQVEENSLLFFLGISSLGVVGIELAHTLSYAGMPELLTPSGPEKAINFWLSGRIVAAVGFLLAAAWPFRHFSSRAWRAGFAVMALLIAGVWWIGLGHPEWIPRTFIPGQGLTPGKIAVEYLLAGVFAVAAAMFLRTAMRDGNRELGWLATAAWTMALAELFFTMYGNVTDLFNVLGHLYLVIASLMVYRAIFVAGVKQPYRLLDGERRLLRSLIDSVPDLIFFKDLRGGYLGANTAFARYSGIPEADLIGKTNDELMDADLARALKSSDDVALVEGRQVRVEEWRPAADGSSALFEVVKTPLRGPGDDRIGLIGVCRDITEFRKAEERIDQLSHFDQLTGLPNPVHLQDRTSLVAQRAAREKSTFALVMLNIDNFHTVNESIGHAGGDTVLRELAGLLLEAVRADDTVARTGGDEFMILLPDVTPDEAADLTSSLIEATHRPIHSWGMDLAVTTSAGIAMFPDDGSDFGDLRRCADSALHRAKQSGRNTYAFYTEDMQVDSAHRLQLTSDLRTAIDRGELFLHYQPQVSLSDGRIIGAEALVRWLHPEHGLIGPTQFIPLAEAGGLILSIGDWVLRQTLHDAADWYEAGLDLPTIAVNLSAHQFERQDLATWVERALSEVSLPAQRLELELTESVAMEHSEDAEIAIERLRRQGVRVSLDDFGTGYSSMAYLKRFRINRLKIDQSFIRNLATDADDQSIVRATIQMARSLGYDTLAEGVETREQLEVLCREGCDSAQGYFFSPPVPADELVEFLRDRSKLPALWPPAVAATG